MAAALCVYEALLKRHALAPGEIGSVLSLSASKDQADQVLSYAKGFIEASPLLSRQVESMTFDEIRLAGNLSIIARPNSFRTVRGRTIVACVFDEVAYWRDDTSQNPDSEVYTAVVPSLAAAGGPLIGISSPYRRAGLLFEKHKRYFGENDPDILVVQGSSKDFNHSLSQKMIDRLVGDDPEGQRAEWLGEFRSVRGHRSNIAEALTSNVPMITR